MHYLVMDGRRTVRTEVEADSPRQAREQAARRIGWRGSVKELEVYVRENPLEQNREATQEFFGARPPIIL